MGNEKAIWFRCRCDVFWCYVSNNSYWFNSTQIWNKTNNDGLRHSINCWSCFNHDPSKYFYGELPSDIKINFVPCITSQLILGRFLIGTAVGCYLFLVQIYVGEISSTKNRGSFLSFVHIFVHLGIAFIYTLGHFVSHRTLNIIYGAVPLFYGIAFQVMIESPPYLASKGKFDKAENSLFKIRENKKLFENELIEMNKSKNVETQSSKSLRELLGIKAVRKGMIIVCTQFFFFQMSGINAMNFYAQSIFKEAGMDNIHPGIASIVYVLFLTTFSSSASIAARHFDRRVMICIFATLNGSCLLVLGSYYNFKDWGYDISGYKWVPLAVLCVNAIAFCHGTALVTWALIGELFTLEAKKVIAPIGQIVSHGLTSLIVLLFPCLVVSIGTGNVFYIFSTTTFCNVIFAYLCIPETRGKTVQEIQEALEK